MPPDYDEGWFAYFGNRMATALLLVETAAKGGFTVFPRLNLTISPEKGEWEEWEDGGMGEWHNIAVARARIKATCCFGSTRIQMIKGRRMLCMRPAQFWRDRRLPCHFGFAAISRQVNKGGLVDAFFSKFS